MKKRQFGFGIIGAGTISEIHALAINAIQNAKLIGVYSINKDKLSAFALRNNCIAFDSLEIMLMSKEIDVVCICTPSGVHIDGAMKAIEAGKHCLIEKPLEVTLEKCDRIIEAADKLGVKVGVVFPSRFYEASKQLKKAIEKKRFGELVFGDAFVKWNRSEAYYQSAAWRGTWQFDGGGALMNQGIHSVDLLQWYMGPVESVQSVSANIRHKGIEVEDTIVSTLQFANGALGTIECSTAVFPGALKRFEIMGTSGTVIMEESNIIKWQFERELEEDENLKSRLGGSQITQGGVANPADISFSGHQSVIEDMITSIETGGKPSIDAIEGRKSVEIVLAIYESVRLGKMVKITGI